MTRIWLNHWFSTAYNIINLIKDGEEKFQIIGSNENNDSVIKCVCDEWYQEPKKTGEEYVDYCLGFCQTHKIDVFLPRREMLEISKKKQLFEKIGTKVMVDDYDVVSVLNNKNEAYELFSKMKIGNVPPYSIVTTLEEFIDAYKILHNQYKRICFKFVYDEGGKSFRLIDNNRKGYGALFRKQSSRMTLDDVISALRERDVFDPIMIMPYLPDNEISVDCLKTEHGIIMLPREKNDTRIERLIFDRNIMDTCSDFYQKIGLEYPCNIQFKYLDGIPYFLEVNTRMSGGIQMACMAANVNIPNIAVNKIIGNNKEWKIDYIEKKITHIETPIIV